MSQSLRRNIHSLTGLRGVSCFFVLLSHCSNEPLLSGSKSLLNSGTMAVYFFFSLSGYLLMNRALHEIQPIINKDTPKRFLGTMYLFFVTRRVFRVYPAFFCAALSYRIMMAIITPEDLIKLPHLSFYDEPFFQVVTFSQSSSHFWTLRTEMIFYVIMLPAILLICAELIQFDYKYFRTSYFKSVIVFYLIVTGIVIYIHATNVFVVEGWFLRDNFIIHLPVFWYGCVGGIISYYLQSYEIKLRIDTAYKKLLLELLTYLLLLKIALGNKIVFKLYLGWYKEVWYTSQDTMSIFNVLLILCLDVTESSSSIGRFMASPLIVYMGEISYSVYLVHYLALLYIEGRTNILYFDGSVAAILLAYFLGFILNKTIEMPGVKAGNRFISKLKLSFQSIGQRYFVINQSHDHIENESA